MMRIILFLALNILLVSEIYADYAATVRTPKGSAVNVTVITSEATAASIAAADKYMASTYPKAIKLRSASRKYNCHSYAWYSTSSSNNVWMNSPGDDKYWLDGSYVLTTSPVAYNKASYVYGDHSAIYMGGRTFYSKWGQYGLYSHDYGYCPYYGGVNKINYYK